MEFRGVFFRSVEQIQGSEIAFGALWGMRFTRTRGHTPGHISIKIESEGETAFIPGALFPTRYHTTVACGVGNDTDGLEAANHKMHFLEQAAEKNWLMLLEHDPDVAGNIKKDGGSKYHFEPQSHE